MILAGFYILFCALELLVEYHIAKVAFCAKDALRAAIYPTSEIVCF